jgi:hypothetical protein
MDLVQKVYATGHVGHADHAAEDDVPGTMLVLVVKIVCGSY